MNRQTHIKTHLQRITATLTQEPERGLGTAVSTTKITSGMACETREGEWTIRTDMPKGAGGSGSAPTPGVLGRAALGSCLAVGYVMWAAKLDVPIESIEVEIATDYDDGGLFGTSDASPGYSEVRHTVRIQSDAPQEAILKVIEAGDKHSPLLDVFSNAQCCVKAVEIRGS